MAGNVVGRGCVGDRALVRALDRGLVDEDTEIFCHFGLLSQGGFQVPDHHPYGSLAVWQVLQKSSNIGAYKLARMLGPERFAAHVRNLGFAARTGIHLPGEARGTMPDHADPVAFSRMSYGYGVTVTPLQVANAYCAIANGGLLMRPWIAESAPAPDGPAVKPGQPEVIRRVMKEETARQMRRALATVCTKRGTASLAMVRGHEVAGKTGTSLKFDPDGRTRKRGHYITSFVGMLPAEQPEFVCLVLIDDPRTREVKRFGGTIAAPTFASIATRVAERMGISAAGPTVEGGRDE